MLGDRNHCPYWLRVPDKHKFEIVTTEMLAPGGVGPATNHHVAIGFSGPGTSTSADPYLARSSQPPLLCHVLRYSTHSSSSICWGRAVRGLRGGDGMSLQPWEWRYSAQLSYRSRARCVRLCGGSVIPFLRGSHAKPRARARLF